MRVLISGDRRWKDAVLIYDILKMLPEGTLIIEGGARGADHLAAYAARVLGLGVRTVPANWNSFGRPAGMIRNRQMLALKPDLLIAFHDRITQSQGTADCLREAERRGISTVLVSHGREGYERDLRRHLEALRAGELDHHPDQLLDSEGRKSRHGKRSSQGGSRSL